ncbi:centrosomal protein of 152 kDa isoform X4 [Cryptotermes secundus]|uniref:centrosomal protein of 152 kDa isoform X4 n=1 Tax=Cryptotermes secundus TaxID=105785 RepID=UPI001454CEC8|nr:centrosomal protein of 152 kDa isoform X4 [Cryptotermes secundus]
MPSLEIMGFAGVIGYYRMLYISWFFAACSLTCFGWYVLLIMEKGKDKKNKNETTSKIFKMQEVCIKKVSEQSAMTNSRRNAFKQKEFQIQKKVTATPHMQLNNVNVNDKKVQKVGEVTESFSQRLNNMEHPTEKIPTQQAEMTTSKTWFIKILGLLFGRTLDKNVDKFKEDIDTLSDRLKKLEDHIKKVENIKEVTDTLSNRMKNVDEKIEEVEKFKEVTDNLSDRQKKLEDLIEKVEKFKRVTDTLSSRLKNVENKIEKVEKFKEVTDNLSDRQQNVEDHIKKVEKYKEVAYTLSKKLKNVEDHMEKVEKYKEVTYTLSKKLKNVEDHMEKVEKFKQVSHTLSNRLKNVEDNIEKIQEDIKVLVSVSVQQSEMALRAKERENEAVSDILSEGLELLEASFKLREDNGKIIDIMSEGVELLEAPFKQVGKCKQVTHTLPNMLKNLEDYIEKEDDAFERLDMVEDSFKKENEVMSCACDSGDSEGQNQDSIKAIWKNEPCKCRI